MCLDYILSKKASDRIIKQAKKRGYIRVFKVCTRKRTGWFYSFPWKKGLKKAIYLKVNNGGWYAFLTKEAAKKYQSPHLKYCYIKTCYTKHQWIKRLGAYHNSGRAGIFTHLVFPDWKKGDMTIREFKEICKQAKK